ncbi:hypothetical protein CYLTODRAFT_204385 [Cylindrobasidium torrendii FP15055 ss-10]|uniref:Uncharacterized protein n=1 Tax=Cylindrobasidium torrendii FP15055 ss-10 TaxID=1314674 RepID=A0A0D7BHV1_9AGAR|nr:hypothetical protein CYLTODRAFT_204385 [Cylindrobasidium torrendii FP15055 ss-10]
MVEAWFACDGTVGGCTCTHHDLPSTQLGQQSLEALFSARKGNFAQNEDPRTNDESVDSTQIQSLKDDLVNIQRNREQLQRAEGLMKAQLITVEDKIAASLRAEKALVHKLTACAAIPAPPALRLPADVLELIFDYVVKRVEMPRRGDSREAWSESCELSEPPSSLGALALTCRDWQLVLEGRPRMWSYIYIDVADRARFERFYVPCITAQLSYTASDNPLHVAIGRVGERTSGKVIGECMSPTYEEERLEDRANARLLSDCMRFLRPYNRRIERLDLFLPYSLLRNGDENKLGSYMPMLARVEVLCTVRDADSLELDYADIVLPRSKRLKEVRLIGLKDWWDAPRVEAPDSIEEYIVEDPQISGITRYRSYAQCTNDLEMLEVVGCYKNLKRLIVDCGNTSFELSDSELEYVPVPVPCQLVHIDITAFIWSPVFLSDFTTPRLEYLRLAMVERMPYPRPEDEDLREVLSDVVRLLRLSRPPLRFLHLENIAADADQFMRLTKLASASYLTELHIIDYPDLRGVVELLETSPYPFPHLRTLDLQGDMGTCRGLAVRIAETWDDTPLDDLRLYWNGWYYSTDEDGEYIGQEIENVDLWIMEVSGALMHIPVCRLEVGRR